MKETWRWFGPADEITIPEIRQTGAKGVVSALHHVPTGAVWTHEEIRKRQLEIEKPAVVSSGLTWDVVESIPVSESIKSQSGSFKEHITAYRQSLENLADCGIEVICYNFMPILDWTRTDLASPLAHGGNAMRFDLVDFVGFDCFLLERVGAREDYGDEILEQAKARISQMDDVAKNQLVNNVVAGLPGANDNWTLGDVRELLKSYDSISAEMLRSNLVDFLSEIIPTAERLGLRLCCHPDDPPFPLLGLPRIMSSEEDYTYMLTAVGSQSNGATFCTGSLGVSNNFDPESFVKKHGDRIHFVHLRNTLREGPSDGERCSFYESGHLYGDTNMVAAIKALMDEEARRKQAGRSDFEIPMRPDHGHAIVGDLIRPMMPGYPLVGRLQGLAEIRGVMAAYERFT